MKESNIKKGEIYYADLSPVVESEQCGVCPVLIVQNDIGNKSSPTVIAAAIGRKNENIGVATWVDIQCGKYGLPNDSVVILEQLMRLDKKRIKEKIGQLNEEDIEKINECLNKEFNL